MKQKKQYSGALLPFYILVIYVLAQFSWWSYLMYDQANIIYAQKLVAASANTAQQVILHKELQGRYYMIAGEGSVFLAIMLLGIFQVRKAFRKESQLLARQKTFLHSITHEFKSPVASLRLQLETLLKHNLPAELQQQALSNALEDTDRLDKLIEKVLVAARIDNGELPLYPEQLNLSEKVKDVVLKIERSNPGRNIEQSIAENVITYMDKWAFSSIVTNLVENALLYSPKDKPVEVSLAKNGNTIVLTVKDNGTGIPQEERAKIFQKFYRLGNASKGTGLGLYLVDYFVKKNKGSITVKENTPVGSIFEVDLPVKKI